MSDSDLSNKSNFTKNRNDGSSQKLKDQVAAAGGEMKERAGSALQASSNVARETLQEMADSVKDMASSTVDQIQGQAREQQSSGADYIGRLADDIREAAHAFEKDLPFAVRGINTAADYVEEAATQIRNGGFRDVVNGVTGFAKRQPAAFLGISVLAGFAAVRFLRATGGESAAGDAGGASFSKSDGAWSAASSDASETWRQDSAE